MDKYVLDVTIKIINQKRVITTTEVKDVVGLFVVKLRGLKTNIIFNKQLPLNEYDDNLMGN